MEVVSKEISANMSSMAIIDAKEGAFWPLTTSELLRLWFHYIQDNGNSVFVVISNDALVCVCTVRCNDTIAFGRVLCSLIVGHELLDVLRSSSFNLATSSLIEVLTYLSIRVRPVVVTFYFFEAILNEAGRGKLECCSRKTLLCVEETCCALSSCSTST